MLLSFSSGASALSLGRGEGEKGKEGRQRRSPASPRPNKTRSQNCKGTSPIRQHPLQDGQGILKEMQVWGRKNMMCTCSYRFPWRWPAPKPGPRVGGTKKVRPGRPGDRRAATVAPRAGQDPGRAGKITPGWRGASPGLLGPGPSGRPLTFSPQPGPF